MSASAICLRLAAAIVALGAGAAAAVIAALLLHRTPGPAPRTSAPTAPAPATTSSAPAAPAATTSSSAGSQALPNAVAPVSGAFPAPPSGSVVFAREDGANAVALAVLPGRPLRLQASVVGPDGSGVRRLAVRFRVLGAGRFATATARPCGAGCYAATLDPPGRPERVVVHVGRRPLAFPMPQRWPPPSASRIVARAGKVWRSLRTLVSHERLASDPKHAITTVWRFAAPNRLRYDILGGPSAVVIGNRRWDRQPGGRWVASPQQPEILAPLPFWVEAVDAHVLGVESVRGRPAWRVSFFDPRSEAWFTVAIDRATARTLDLRMTTTAHFMHDVYGPFDAPVQIAPPVPSGGKR